MLPVVIGILPVNLDTFDTNREEDEDVVGVGVDEDR